MLMSLKLHLSPQFQTLNILLCSVQRQVSLLPFEATAAVTKEYELSQVSLPSQKHSHDLRGTKPMVEGF